MRWPAEWRDARALDLVRGTPFGCLLIPNTDDFRDVIQRARDNGLTVADPKDPPPDVEVAKGEWPGIRAGQGGDASSGPTGAPWIDSNGWLIRLTRIQKPNTQVWLQAEPPKPNEVKPVAQHMVAVADSAAHGGRWVITLDSGMATALAAGKPEFVTQWKRLCRTAEFFRAHDDWRSWPVRANVGVVSSFSGDNEFFSKEVLNLTARTNVSYRIFQKDELRPDALQGLVAVIYPDSDAPSPELRKVLLEYVAGGGLLICGPKWGMAPGAHSAEQEHPRYTILRFGKGRIARAQKDPDDPYQVAQDAQILVSHRHDLVRFFNGFALGAYFTSSPDGKRALVHVVNYAGSANFDALTARIAGRFSSARLWTFEAQEPKALKTVAQKDALEVHLPWIPVYGALELEI